MGDSSRRKSDSFGIPTGRPASVIWRFMVGMASTYHRGLRRVGDDPNQTGWGSCGPGSNLTIVNLMLSLKHQGEESRSLADVHSTVGTSQVSVWKRMFAFAGPAYLVSVGYMDPGNWATDLEGGARFGYSLLWVPVSYTHLRAHETRHDLVCRL